MKSSAYLSTVLIALGAVALGGPAACSDYGLLEATPRPDGGLSGDGGNQGLSAECDTCLRASRPSGSSCVATCLGDSRCQIAYTCTTYLKCIEDRRRQEAINCALPCGQNARIGSLEDPSGKLLLGVLDCAIANCSQACGLTP